MLRMWDRTAACMLSARFRKSFGAWMVFKVVLFGSL
jgi:hypothetical protein